MADPGADARKELDWDLHIHVPTQGVRKSVRVTSDESVGALMIKIAEKLGDADWSDYALWWPDNRIWLNKPRQSLYAYGIMSDAKLEFSPVHRHLTVELPDRHRYQVRVNFAVMTFFTVCEICQELNVRHPEEMSLIKSPDDKEGYAKLTGWAKRKGVKHRGGSREGTPSRGDGDTLSVDSGDILGHSPPSSPGQRRRKYPNLALAPSQRSEIGMSGSTHLGEAETSLFSDKLYRTSHERTYINGLWLDSSKTLYEQDVNAHDLLYLRFKYFSFMDIDPRVDDFRIAELYEQAKWSILTEEVDCTEEEAYTFAALQFQVNLAKSQAPSSLPVAQTTTDSGVTDIDDALTNLQNQLGQTDKGTSESPALQLTGYCKLMRPTRLTFKTPKRHFLLLKGTMLSYFKEEEDFTHGRSPIQRLNLTGAEALSDMDMVKKKFVINLVMPSSDQTGELRLIFETSDEYCSWMAGCRMAMKGRPLVKQGYEQELSSIRAFVSMQNKSDSSGGASSTDHGEELKPEDLVGPRLLKKKKPKEVCLVLYTLMSYLAYAECCVKVIAGTIVYCVDCQPLQP
ncbi:Fermitin family homolog 1 [Geodia barretti]|uniref:Fermitin family homolog 1 n=1 Tax=Geodia barretti TaxID=519541 RepID=A0AA35TX43_GEOBA|nr:Fermitin family homolog 1 [Geodia barretti]